MTRLMPDQITEPVPDHIGHVSIDVRCPKCGRGIRISNIDLGRADANTTSLYCACGHAFMNFQWAR